MITTEMLNKLEDVITKTYEPILVIKMMRMPSIQEMEGFRQYLKNEFGFNLSRRNGN